MPVQQLKDYLDIEQIPYLSVKHSPAYTAQEIAKRAHIKGNQLAKTVIVTIDGSMAMIVLPASCRIRWDRFTKSMGTDFIELADEEEFQDRFPDCEVGAMPPFGNLFDMDVYLYDDLAKNEEIAFSAGSHSEIIKMRFDDYKTLAQPTLLSEGFVNPDTRMPDWMCKRKVG